MGLGFWCGGLGAPVSCCIGGLLFEEVNNPTLHNFYDLAYFSRLSTC